MEKILSNDKILLVVVGALITSLVALFFPVAAPAAFLATIVVAFIKGIIIRFTQGMFDFVEFGLMCAGGLIVQILIWGFL